MKTALLGNICDLISRGISPVYTDSVGITVLNQKCIRDHSINFGLARRHDIIKKKVDTEKLIREGDVLVNSTGHGTLGRVAQVKAVSGNATVDSHITIVRPSKSLFYLPFFGYAMIMVEGLLESEATGTSGQTELPRSVLQNSFKITYPESTDEQKRIVKKLDKAFATIDKAKANTEKSLANVKELFEIKLNELFSEESNKQAESLGRLVLKTSNIDWKNNVEASFKYIDLSSVDRLSSSIKTSIMVNRNNAPSRAKQIVLNGDVIFGTTRPTLKRIAFIQKDYADQICSTGFCVLRADKARINPKLIYYFLKTKKFMGAMEKLQRGASYPAVTDGDVKAQTIRFAKSLADQNKDITELDQLSDQTQKLQKLYQQKLENLEELKQAILQQAFEGKL